MRIDAHQHYWTIERGDYGWLTPELATLYRDFGPEHLAPHLRDHNIGGTIVVQAAATHEETDYLLSLSDAAPSIVGVVGWLDLEDAGYMRHLERFRQHPKYVGTRIMIQDMPNPEAALAPNVVGALQTLAELALPVDLLVLSEQLPVLLRLLELVPGLHGVVDHLAKPRIAAGELEPWGSQLRAIAAHPSIYCKLSGMVTEARHDIWQPADFVPYVRHIVDVFGTKRVMFGSDWPVCLLAASYDDVMDVLANALPPSLSQDERDDIYGNNARTFYKL